MRTINRKIVVSTLLLTLAVSSLAYSNPVEGKGPHDKKFSQKRMDMLIEKLGLTPEQKEQFIKHKEERRGTMKGLHQSLRAKRKELREELMKPEYNKAAVDARSQELKALMGEMVDRKTDGFLEMKKILTKEQLEEFIKMKKEWHSKNGKKGSRQK